MEFPKLTDPKFQDKILKRELDKKWKQNALGNLLIVYQTEEKAEKVYHARSFEDAFFHINQDFICNEKIFFQGLTDKWLEEFKINKNVHYARIHIQVYSNLMNFKNILNIEKEEL